MPSKHPQRASRSVLPRKKRSIIGGRLDFSLYTVEGYLSWVAKAQKSSKRSHSYSSYLSRHPKPLVR